MTYPPNLQFAFYATDIVMGYVGGNCAKITSHNWNTEETAFFSCTLHWLIWGQQVSSNLVIFISVCSISFLTVKVVCIWWKLQYSCTYVCLVHGWGLGTRGVVLARDSRLQAACWREAGPQLCMRSSLVLRPSPLRSLDCIRNLWTAGRFKGYVCGQENGAGDGLGMSWPLGG